MKKTFLTCTSLLLTLLLIFSLVSCDLFQKEEPQTTAQEAEEGATIEKTGLWANATYVQDTEFGEGAKTTVVEVKVNNQVVKFTIHTDKDTVGAALLEHDLIAGEDGAYGLYIKVVNGITADYDIDQSYWSFYVNGDYAMTGVDSTAIEEGAVYSLVYTK